MALPAFVHCDVSFILQEEGNDGCDVAVDEAIHKPMLVSKSTPCKARHID